MSVSAVDDKDLNSSSGGGGGNILNQELMATPIGPPKLKIRFRGAGEVVTVCDPALTDSAAIMSNPPGGDAIPPREEDSEAKKIRFRPPKKRLSDSGSDMMMMKPMGANDHLPARSDSNPPTLEELWRQSMKFREEVMADFSKSERRKGQPGDNDNGSNGNKPADGPPGGLDAKPEFKNKRHKTKTRKDRSKSKDRDGNNRKRPLVASTDLMSIAGGGCAGGGTDASNSSVIVSLSSSGGDGGGGENNRKRKRSLSGGSGSNASTGGDGPAIRNGVRIISKDNKSSDNNSSAPPKLIIRFGKKPVSETVASRHHLPIDLKLPNALVDGGGDHHQHHHHHHLESQGSEDVTPPPPLEKPEGDENVSSAVTSMRLMPIKLKLARCSQGSYVTKAKSDSTPPPSPTAAHPKESCEVR